MLIILVIALVIVLVIIVIALVIVLVIIVIALVIIHTKEIRWVYTILLKKYKKHKVQTQK